MYSTRLIHLLMAALSFITLAQASWLDFGFVGKAKNEFVARQDSTSASTSARTTSRATTSSVAPTTSSSTEATTTEPPTTTTPVTTPTTTPSSTTKPITTPDSTSQPTPTPTGGDSSSTTSDPATTDAPTSATTSATPFTTLIVTTVTESNGNVVTSSSSAVITPTSLTSSSTSGDNTGMTDGTRNTIIGVCVGVGGAIVLAVAGLLFWRLRRKRQQEDNEDLVTYGAGTSQFNSGPEKSEASGSLTGRSPFQSTLESYHAPTQSNTGTNF